MTEGAVFEVGLLVDPARTRDIPGEGILVVEPR